MLANAGPKLKLGATSDLHVDSACPSTAGVMMVGGSTTFWNGLPLPLPLDALGATDASLLVSPDLAFFLATDAQGQASLKFKIPPQNALIGVVHHAQAFLLEPQANAVGLASSNGYSTPHRRVSRA